VAKHLDAIGPVATRSGMKSRVVQGAATYRVVVGGGGSEEGKVGLVSEAHKLRLVLRFPGNYRGENVLFNGEVVQVAFSNADQSRSPLASFLATQDVIVRDGLLGGALTTAWSLQDLTDRGAKLVYEGLKKVDGHPLHQFRDGDAAGRDGSCIGFLGSRHVASCMLYRRSSQGSLEFR